MYFVFIVNPIAGEMDKQNLVRRMESAIRISENNFIREDTKASGDAQRIAAEYASRYGSDCVIVSCGGDGTVHEIANGVAGTDAKLLVLPLGTGNDFSKTVYKSKILSIEKIMKRFGLLDGNVRFKVQPIDVIDVDGIKCINVMSFGHDTLIANTGRKIAAKFPKLGKKAYDIAAARCILKNMKYKINVDLETVNEDGTHGRLNQVLDYTLMAICNASYYGGGYAPSPNAVIDDGVLEICWIDAINMFEAIPVIPKYADGRADESPLVHTGSLVGGTVKSIDGSILPGNCDGENFYSKEVHFKVERNAINLCMPVE